MKHLSFLFLLTLLACNRQEKQAGKASLPDNAAQAPISPEEDRLESYQPTDTLVIVSESSDTMKFASHDFDKIKADHPEFFSDYPQDPDQAYLCLPDTEEFNSEAGRDDYYMLYAHFLNQKNGAEKQAALRKKLIAIYTQINLLFQHLQHGGSYFGHQYARIPAYASFSVYLFASSKEAIEKTYDITRQKKLYISSLRQLIDDESKISPNRSEAAANQQSKTLYKITDALDRLITDVFLLRSAQQFHYRHYQYY